MADIVFILGAGCSAAAGGPLSSNFLDRAREIYSNGELQTRRAEFELLFKSIGFLQRVHSKAQLDITNLEAVFSALDTAWTLRKLPGIDPSDIERVLVAMRWVIVKTLEHSIRFPHRNGNIIAPEPYGAFSEFLKRNPSGRRSVSSAIITFNYDVCLDIALDDASIPFHYGFDSDPGIPLLKLHGSLNWGRKKNGEIVPWSIRDYRARYKLQFPRDNQQTIFAPISSQMVEAPKAEEIEDLPVIIPPILNKGSEQRQLWQVWQRAAQELGGASHIVVMGYSLPETDQFFRHLFALGTEGNVPFQKVLVFDPDEAVEHRFRSLLGDGAIRRFQFSPFIFSGAVDVLPRNLL